MPLPKNGEDSHPQQGECSENRAHARVEESMNRQVLQEGFDRAPQEGFAHNEMCAGARSESGLSSGEAARVREDDVSRSVRKTAG